MDFLYALSASDGADPTRAADTGARTRPATANPGANWGSCCRRTRRGRTSTAVRPTRSRATATAQRDVLRSANFNTGTAQGFAPQVGTFAVVNNRYQVAPSTAGGDAISLFNQADTVIPVYFEMQATINAVKPTGGNGQRLPDLRLAEQHRLQVRGHQRVDQQARDRALHGRRLGGRQLDQLPAQAGDQLRRDAQGQRQRGHADARHHQHQLHVRAAHRLAGRHARPQRRHGRHRREGRYQGADRRRRGPGASGRRSRSTRRSTSAAPARPAACSTARRRPPATGRRPAAASWARRPMPRTRRST